MGEVEGRAVTFTMKTRKMLRQRGPLKKKIYVCVSMHVYAAFHMPSIQETQKMGTKSPGTEVGW